MHLRSVQEIGEFIFVDDLAERVDAIMIPGGSYPETGEHAAYLFRMGVAPLVIPSGSHSFKVPQFPGPKSRTDQYCLQYGTESAFLRDVLELNGVPTSAILEEPLATFTMDNAWKTAELITTLGLAVESAAIVSKPFHARRSLLCYELAMPKVRFVCCPYPDLLLNRQNWFKSRQGRERVLEELQKCGEHFVDTFDALLDPVYGIGR